MYGKRERAHTVGVVAADVARAASVSTAPSERVDGWQQRRTCRTGDTATPTVSDTMYVGISCARDARIQQCKISGIAIYLIMSE